MCACVCVVRCSTLELGWPFLSCTISFEEHQIPSEVTVYHGSQGENNYASFVTPLLCYRADVFQILSEF